MPFYANIYTSTHIHAQLNAITFNERSINQISLVLFANEIIVFFLNLEIIFKEKNHLKNWPIHWSMKMQLQLSNLIPF